MSAGEGGRKSEERLAEEKDRERVTERGRTRGEIEVKQERENNCYFENKKNKQRRSKNCFKIIEFVYK